MAHPNPHEGVLLDELDGALVAEGALVPGKRPLQVGDRQLEVVNAVELWRCGCRIIRVPPLTASLQ